jgi:flagellar hook assembly protein FlgD
MSRDGDDTPIRQKQKDDQKHGILLEKAVVSQIAKISVKTPEQAQINIAIYDNAGNVIYKTSGKSSDTFVWDLTNTAGRNVANGTYLIVAEAKGAKGTYAYSAKVGVKR